MRRIIVLNSKGGCGKTTVATNLASLYASWGLKSTLFDYDPQGSSTCWLESRGAERNGINGVAAYARTKSTLTRSWQLRVPPETERLIIDTPASLDKPQLLEHLRGVDLALVPIAPSAIDIRAATGFIQELLAVNKTGRARIGIIANRIRDNSFGLQALERFAETVGLPIVARFRDCPTYLDAAELGIGVQELGDEHPDRKAWQSLVDWLESEPETATQIVNA